MKKLMIGALVALGLGLMIEAWATDTKQYYTGAAQSGSLVFKDLILVDPVITNGTVNGTLTVGTLSASNLTTATTACTNGWNVQGGKAFIASGTSALTGTVTFTAIPIFGAALGTAAAQTVTITNAPTGTSTAAAKWIMIKLGDGTTNYFPCWQF